MKCSILSLFYLKVHPYEYFMLTFILGYGIKVQMIYTLFFITFIFFYKNEFEFKNPNSYSNSRVLTSTDVWNKYMNEFVVNYITNIISNLYCDNNNQSFLSCFNLNGKIIETIVLKQHCSEMEMEKKFCSRLHLQYFNSI